MYKALIVDKNDTMKLFAIYQNIDHIEKKNGHVFLYGDAKETIYCGIVNLVYCDIELQEIKKREV